LFQRFKFVVILQNSALPLSNEFVPQLFEISFCYAALSAPLGSKNAIFVVLGGPKRQPDPKGDRVKLTLSGKFLPYKEY